MRNTFALRVTDTDFYTQPVEFFLIYVDKKRTIPPSGRDVHVYSDRYIVRSCFIFFFFIFFDFNRLAVLKYETIYWRGPVFRIPNGAIRVELHRCNGSYSKCSIIVYYAVLLSYKLNGTTLKQRGVIPTYYEW